MKRINHLFEKITSIENLKRADLIARRGKSKQYGVRHHLKNETENIQKLHSSLVNKTYRTSEYTTFQVYEPKERTVYRLPYAPDRILHHAIMTEMEPRFVSWFTADTYSCIKGRGIHGAFRAVKKGLQDKEGTTYCLKLDITKFYPSVAHDVLKMQLRRKLKDQNLLWLLDEIIDSAPGLPIGNYLSQYLANYYLTGFDHWLKQEIGVKYYYRYADDIVILSNNKQWLHKVLAAIKNYLNINLKLKVKQNYQIFPVANRGIDFVGYVFYHNKILLRPSIKRNFGRMISRRSNRASIASYMGWTKHGNCRNLERKLLNGNKRIQPIRNKTNSSKLSWKKRTDRNHIRSTSNNPRLCAAAIN
ncbi:RNA-directed DNA polymerase [Pedobacter sp. Hv1]|uniref:RNA-directed DNA polymerase n=1 Tax=Pedobacter sp. Hv1 TaxID=1740090 RepID=UPI0009EC1A8C|nr:RNA-directed DNA polymerase [Pedobacter sp. Hv1]